MALERLHGKRHHGLSPALAGEVRKTNAATPELAENRPPGKLTGVSYQSASAIAARLGLDPLKKKIEKLAPQKVAHAIEATERRQRVPLDAALRARLSGLAQGKTALIPINVIRPGQTQISYANVRTKMLDFVKRIEDAKDGAGAPESLLKDEEALDAVVGPGGKYLVLVDGHHHIAALKAVDELVEQILGNSIQRGAARATWKPGREIQRVHDLFHGPGGVPAVPIRIIGNMSAMSERDFWKQLAEGGGGHQRLAYLVDRHGRKAKVGPREFSELEDNPFRNLAAALTGKVRSEGAGKHAQLILSGPEKPVWLKLMEHAPPFVEFEMARCLEASFRRAGLRYDPDLPLTKEMRTVARAALYFAKNDPLDPLHEILRDVPIIIREVSREKLEREVTLNDAGTALEVPKKLLKPSKRRVKRWEKALG